MRKEHIALRHKTTAATVAAILLFTMCAFGDEVDSVLRELPRGSHPVGKNIIAELRPFGNDADVMRTRTVDVAGMHFKKALEIEISRTATYVHWATLRLKNTEPILKGDVLFLSLYTKSLHTTNDTGAGHLLATYRTDWPDRAFEMEFVCRDEWERQYVKGVAKADYQPGEGALIFFCGFRPQKILVADIQLINFGRQVDADAMPVMPLSYDGMEPDAQWRKRALDRIEKYRKSNIEVAVKAVDGRPVADAHVSVTMTRNAFGFGGPYQTGLYRPDRAGYIDIDIYQQKFKLHFNKAVLPNAMKWKQYPSWGKVWAPKAVEWLTANNIPVRGHCLIWPGWKYLPPELKQYETDPEQLRQLARDHIKEMLSAWRGKFAEWDVVNEVYMQHAMLDVCGTESLVDWFKLARELDPDTKLTYNDASALVNNQPAHQDHYFETIKWLLDEGAPVDIMGFQGHIHTLIPPEVTYKRIERFADLGPEIEITEFDIQTPGVSDEMAARYARDFMIAVFSHPKTIGIVTWLGSNPLRRMPGRRSRAQTAFYDENWNITPLGQVWLDLKNKDWHTDVKGKTDTNGVYRTRGFHGEYQIKVTRNDKTVTRSVTVGTQDLTMEIVL
jgi:endo-1,4-beta-xylanase